MNIYDPPNQVADLITWREYLTDLQNSQGDHSAEIERSKKIIEAKESA